MRRNRQNQKSTSEFLILASTAIGTPITCLGNSRALWANTKTDKNRALGYVFSHFMCTAPGTLFNLLESTRRHAEADDLTE